MREKYPICSNKGQVHHYVHENEELKLILCFIELLHRIDHRTQEEENSNDVQ